VCGALIERAASRPEIVITKSGRPRARLVPLEDSRPERVPGKGKGRGASAETSMRHCRMMCGRRSRVLEVAIKTSLGKLSSSRSVALATAESGFVELPIEFTHAEQVARLPAHHWDPFDRIMIAQAQDLVIISRDAVFRAYEVALIAG
jgi:hypothetical protein